MEVQTKKDLSAQAVAGNTINTAKSRKQAGASLFEALMFIVVGALVIAGVIGLGVKVFNTNTENRSNEQLVEISTAIKSVFAGQQNYGTAGTNLLPTLNTANSLPSDLSYDTGTSTATNLYGGGVEVEANGTTYTVAFNDLNDDVCVKMATKTQPGWVSVEINASGTPIVSLPVAPATAVAQCNAGAGANDLIWTGR